MGLPLYVSPVESDIPSKPAAKNPADPAHSRSPIRRPQPRSPYHRSERRRQLHETREHRLRLLAALQDHDDSPPPLISASSSSRSNAAAVDHISSSSVTPQEELNLIRERRRQRRLERLDEALVDRPQPLRRVRDSYRDTPRSESRYRPSYIGWSADLFPSDSTAETPEDIHGLGQVWGQLGGIAMPPYLTSRTEPPHDYPVSVRRPSPLARDSEGYRVRVPPRRSEHPAVPGLSSRYIRQGHRVRYVDGLGDRDRSLSPEGDGVWDTLQSTLTPDPQPPSVGSSFASTTASAAASQNTSANSSANTSVTSPDGEIEPPCDHDSDESEDADETELRNSEPSRRPTPHGRRSYADVAADVLFDTAPRERDDGSDRPEWLSGMHRIVRGLASRQDIPDEWWAEAGLSRSMRYEDSN